MNTITPYRRPLRLPRSIGNVSTPSGTDDVVTVLAWRMQDKGPHLVLVSSSGDVYPVPYKDYRAELLWAAHPTWVAGTFTMACSFNDIGEALVHVWREQNEAVA